MVPRLVGTEGLYIFVDSLRRNLTIDGGDGEHLVSRRLDGTRLVQGYVARSGSDNTLVGAQQSLDDGRVGLRATNQEVYLTLIGRKTTRREYLLACRSTIVVGAVARGLFHIGAHQRLQNQRMRALHIV